MAASRSNPPTPTPPSSPLPPDSILVDPRHDDDPLSALVTAHIEWMAAACGRGEKPRVEDFLARHPELSDEEAIRLIYEEVCLRQEAGEAVASSEVLRRFPTWRSKLALLLDCNRLMRARPVVEFPRTGDDLGDFHLIAEIGRGAAGVTFLARQRSLAQRPVVLKVTPVDPLHEEHLSLARLQHMHIVPLYFENLFEDRGLRMLGMPYLGGASLARVLEDLAAIPIPQRKGAHLLESATRHTIALAEDRPPTYGPNPATLTRATYVEAVCWIGACLADALQYAHDRGLVHLDVKPSNILLADDGQPMLLDFHLASNPIAAGDTRLTRLGGTPGYLSPEQDEAMRALRGGAAVPTAIDGRSDVYSLGVVLHEALGGESSRDARDRLIRRPLHRCQASLPRGLSDIVAKCLAEKPSERYRDAGALAADLRRHLNAAPLRGVANRSLSERWGKWRRRNPAGLARVLLGLLLIGIVVGAIGALVVVDRQIAGMIYEAEENRKAGRHKEAVRLLKHGLNLSRRFSIDREKRRALQSRLRTVQTAEVVGDLRGAVDRLRFQQGIATLPDDESEWLVSQARAIWNQRKRLLELTGSQVSRETADQVRRDLLDLAIILADLQHRSASDAEAVASRAEALRILDEAENELGPSLVLSRERANYESAPDAQESHAPPARTAWEHYALGRHHLRANRLAAARAAFDRAIALRPGEFWPYFSRYVCEYRQKEFEAAEADLNICVALAPGTAECYYNRALVREALGRIAEARDDHTRALALNRELSVAALNRGILALREQDFDTALADFDHALAHARGHAARGRAQYHRALALLGKNDREAGLEALRTAADEGDAAAKALYEQQTQAAKKP